MSARTGRSRPSLAFIFRAKKRRRTFGLKRSTIKEQERLFCGNSADWAGSSSSGWRRRSEPIEPLVLLFWLSRSRAPTDVVPRIAKVDEPMRNTVLPIALIVFGLAWLAREMGWFHEVHMIVALAIIVLGAAILATEGINRSSVVSGPILVYVGAAWLAYDQGYVSSQVVWPVGVIVLGILLFIARLPAMPDPQQSTRRRRDRSQS